MTQISKVQIPRRDKRYETLGMSCPLGDVLDLSASGMKIGSSGKPAVSKGELKQFVLRTTKQTLTLSGRVQWIRRQSPLSKRYEIGVRFVDTRPSIREAVAAFAQYGFIGPGAQKLSHERVASATIYKTSKVVEDYYKFLSVDRRATQPEIRRAFWVLAKANHPDVTSDPCAEARFRKAIEAREVLLDTMKRRRFDDLLSSQDKAA